MSYFRKKLERRTFSQDRYYILIKRQREGSATFNELTELDEIVNRVPDIRDLVIRENFGEDESETDKPTNDPLNQNPATAIRHIQHQNIWSRVKNWLNRNFNEQISTTKEKEFAPLF
jgi:hypothetical protein